MKQESHSSSSSSSSPSSPTVGDLSVRERGDVTNSDISPVPVSEFVDDSSGRPDEDQANKIPKTNKKETTITRGDPVCSDNSEIPEWLQEFRENLVDDEIPLQGGSHASSSHEASLEPIDMRREDLGKHNVHTHFPKDRNCEICKRTKITRAPCRRRNGEAVPRAVNFGDLITADHKVLSRWSRIRGLKEAFTKDSTRLVGNGKPTGSVLKETIAVAVTKSVSVQNRHSRILLRILSRSRTRNASRNRSPSGKRPSVECFDCPCKDYLKGTCTNSFCEKWHPPVCLFYKSESRCRFWEKCSYAHRQIEEQPSKRSRKEW